MSIMLPSESENDNPPKREWRAKDITPAEVAACADRFTSYYEVNGEDECWLWQGTIQRSGYGVCSIGQGKLRYVARIAWVLASGQTLSGDLSIDHLCNTPLCVNPKHLEPVTVGENSRRKNQRRGWATSPEESEARRRVKNLEWYYANREAVLARSTEMVQCETCDKRLRRGSLRSHSKRFHDEAA